MPLKNIMPKLPYETTKIDPYSTQGEISKLLSDYGAQNIQWTGMFRDNNVDLKFILKTRENKLFTVQMIPPNIQIKKRTWNKEKFRNEVILVSAWSQSMRLLYWYIESKLKAIRWGLVSFEKEFLGDISVQLPSGGSKSVFELIIHPLSEGTLAIEDKVSVDEKQKKQKIIDVEYKEVS